MQSTTALKIRLLLEMMQKNETININTGLQRKLNFAIGTFGPVFERKNGVLIK